MDSTASKTPSRRTELRVGIDVAVLRHSMTGVGRYVASILSHFRRTDVPIKLILYSPTPPKLPEMRIPFELRTGHGWSRYAGTPWFQTQGLRLIKNDALDVFWGPQQVLPRGLPGTLEAVVTVNDLVSYRYPKTMSAYNYLVNRLYSKQAVARAARIIVPSLSTKEDLVSIFGVNPAKVYLTYLGVDSSFVPHEPSRARRYVSAKYHVPERFILAVGTIEPRKNYPVLVQGLALLKPQTSLVLVGKPGWGADRIPDRCGPARIYRIGYVASDDLPLFYSAAQCFVSASLYEGFGLPVLEAMACHTPVVASALPVHREIGADTIIYFDPRSPQSLADSISSVLGHPINTRALAASALRRSRSFSWSKVADRTMDIICPPG